MAEANVQPQLPIPISVIEDKYLLFDIQGITWLRKTHNICGVFLGSLPQNPSQNVFLGLPMEIMPEEAQLLIDVGIGYILDDAKAHDAALARANWQRQTEYTTQTNSQATEISDAYAAEKEGSKKKALKKAKAKKQIQESCTTSSTEETDHQPPASGGQDDSESLFADTGPPPQSTLPMPQTMTEHPHLRITPASSSTLISASHLAQRTTSQSSNKALLPNVQPKSYNLYRHLHSLPNRSYFLTPGLRFGCQFCVYPGDPLRFHSHFLAVGVDWDEEIDLMDVVTGGRLGTGVKKGYLIGGRDESVGRDAVRIFSIEWAGM